MRYTAVQEAIENKATGRFEIMQIGKNLVYVDVNEGDNGTMTASVGEAHILKDGSFKDNCTNDVFEDAASKLDKLEISIDEFVSYLIA